MTPLNLRDCRLARGLTQVRLAHLAGCTRQTIISHERAGTWPVGLPLRRALARILRVPCPSAPVPNEPRAERWG